MSTLFSLGGFLEEEEIVDAPGNDGNASMPEQFKRPSGTFVENSTTLSCLETIGYLIKYGRVLWLLELQIRRGRKV